MTADEALEECGLSACLNAIWRASSKSQKQGIVLDFMKMGMSQTEIAKDIGVGLGYVSRLARLAFKLASGSDRAAINLQFRDHSRPRMERFWDFVSPEPNSGCWIWEGNDNGNGYGIFGINYNQKYAHRLSYEDQVATIPEGLEIDHLCRVRCCVNPDHLEPVTKAENIRRAKAFRCL